jgi:hypothetical protein
MPSSPGGPLPRKVFVAGLEECRVGVGLAAVLFPVPVESRESYITGGTRFSGGFPPGFALGV